MLITGTEYKPEKRVPQVRIQVEMPRREGDLTQTPTMYGMDVSSVPQIPIDQTMLLRVSVIPGDERIFDMNPKLFLFRYVNRPNKKNEKFRKGGKHLVHPVDSGVNRNHRYRGGSHTNPYQIIPRYTEFDLNINTNSLTGKKEFYGGSDTNPDGTIIKFHPLARFTNSYDISQNSIRFPQPMYQNTPGVFDSGVGVEAMIVQNGSGNPRLQYRYGGKGRGYKGYKRFDFGVMLMVENPEYDGTTQTPQYLSASNLSEFILTYKTAVLTDGVNGIVGKYAVDRRILPK